MQYLNKLFFALCLVIMAGVKSSPSDDLTDKQRKIREQREKFIHAAFQLNQKVSPAAVKPDLAEDLTDRQRDIQELREQCIRFSREALMEMGRGIIPGILWPDVVWDGHETFSNGNEAIKQEMAGWITAISRVDRMCDELGVFSRFSWSPMYSLNGSRFFSEQVEKLFCKIDSECKECKNAQQSRQNLEKFVELVAAWKNAQNVQ